jgi:hypothetical protein
MGDKCLPTLVVGDEDEVHRPFREGENRVGLFGLLVSWDKPNVPAQIRMRIDMLWWPRIAAEFHGVYSQIGSIKTTRKGMSCFSEEARAWRTALSMSSGSYSGLVIHEPVQR